MKNRSVDVIAISLLLFLVGCVLKREKLPEMKIVQRIDLVYDNGDKETVYREFASDEYKYIGTAYRHCHLYRGCINVIGRCYVRSFNETEVEVLVK